jgi:hypothetical protein
MFIQAHRTRQASHEITLDMTLLRYESTVLSLFFFEVH